MSTDNYVRYINKINIVQAIADQEHRKDIEVMEYKHNLEYIEDKVEMLEAVDPVLDLVLDYLDYLQEENCSLEDYEYIKNIGSGPPEDYEFIENIASGAITNIEDMGVEDMDDEQYMDKKCKETNVFCIFYNIFRNYICIPILNIWNS